VNGHDTERIDGAAGQLERRPNRLPASQILRIRLGQFDVDQERMMMELVRWNPLKEMSLLRNHFSSFFSDPFFPAEMAGDEGSRNVWHPAVDIFEKDGKMVIKAEFKDGILTVEVPSPETPKPKQITVN
jgi:HSP20 family molecular chaperone IbpA